jgi:predicted transcriptional regulator
MKLSLEQFNKLIADITTARQLQRGRNEQKALEDEFQKEDIEKFQRVLQPVLEETITSPIHKLQEGLTKNLKQIEGRQKQLEAIQGAPSEVLPAALASETRGIARSATTIPLINIDPDNELDFELLKRYNYLKPSELFRVEKPRELVCTYIKEIDTRLMSWGGQIAKIKDKKSEEYNLLSHKIEGMRAYKERIKDLLRALTLAGRGTTPVVGGGEAAPKGQILKYPSKIFPKNYRIAESRMQNLIEYKYYSSPDELIYRLELLCAERDIGNDSIEVRNEIMSILDLLLKNKIIDKVYHEQLFRKWCS